jgi:hypothetical protein
MVDSSIYFECRDVLCFSLFQIVRDSFPARETANKQQGCVSKSFEPRLHAVREL